MINFSDTRGVGIGNPKRADARYSIIVHAMSTFASSFYIYAHRAGGRPLSPGPRGEDGSECVEHWKSSCDEEMEGMEIRVLNSGK